MLWIAIAFPTLPIEACSSSKGPTAVVEQHRITLLDADARAAGVQRGHKRAAALALCPTLTLIERDLPRERQAVHGVALALLRFTPHVCLVCDARGQHGLLLEVRGSLRLFGGFVPLLHAIRFTVSELGHAHEAAAFTTATGAWLLAQHDALQAHLGLAASAHTPVDEADPLAALDTLPVALLDAAQPHLDVLAGIGARTLRDVRLLPRAGLAQRFGQPLLDEIDRAYGEAPDPRPWFEAPAAFRTRLELFARVESAEALLFSAHRLLVQLVGWLTARHAAVRTFTFVLAHEAGRRAPTDTPLEITLATASNDLDHLTLLLREHLGRTRLAAPVLELELTATHVETARTAHGELFATTASETESLARLIERLKARLGVDAVKRIALAEDHRPEHAQQWVAPETPIRAVASNPAAGARPAWLLDPPIRLGVREHRPFYQGPLRLVAGPERIEAGWWNGLAVRDYFIAESDDARLMWVYRERLQDGHEGWYLQGKFA